MTTTHNGTLFRLDRNPFRGTSFLLHKPTGRYIVMDSATTFRFEEAMWSAPSCDFTSDDCYAWVWANAGFHRYAEAA